MMKRINVAVGVILDENNRVLIAKRSSHQHQGGLWEFPGGKVEAGEDTPSALVRELKEELGMDISGSSLKQLILVEHDYTDKQVALDVWIVEVSRLVADSAYGAEGQDICWVEGSKLDEFEFPAANSVIVEELRQYLFSND